MKKFASVALTAALLLTLFAGCGAKAPAETEAPETTVMPETTVAPEMTEEVTEETGTAQMTELEKLAEAIYANHAETDLPIMTTVLDVADPDLLTYNTGLTSGEKLDSAVVSELMMGQPYSMVLVKVRNAADTAAVAQEMYDSIDQRKWICVEADTKIAGYYDDIAMVFMVGSDFSEDVSTQSMMEAFKAAAGKDVTVIE